MYIIDNTKTENQSSVDNEMESEPVQNATANQKQLNNSVQKSGAQSQAQTDTQQIAPIIGAAGNVSGQSSGKTGHQSAFKMVSRSSTQKKPSMFYVSQVPEDSLVVNKSPEHPDEIDTKAGKKGSDKTNAPKS